MKKAIVIIPTVGGNELKEAVDSVLNQTYPETYCLVVVDGPQFTEKVNNSNLIIDNNKSMICYLPFNTGGGREFYGQKIMTAFSYLIKDFDYVFFLDQDNYFELNHIESLIKTIEDNKYEWAYSLRKIVGKKGNYICNDDCESLGRWPIWLDPKMHLIDNNCYGFTKDFLQRYAYLMHWGWGADRRFYHLLKDTIHHKNYGCSGLYTVNYRLDGNDGSVEGEFFLEGNMVMREKYSHGNFPWAKE